MLWWFLFSRFREGKKHNKQENWKQSWLIVSSFEMLMIFIFPLSTAFFLLFSSELCCVFAQREYKVSNTTTLTHATWTTRESPSSSRTMRREFSSALRVCESFPRGTLFQIFHLVVWLRCGFSRACVCVCVNALRSALFFFENYFLLLFFDYRLQHFLLLLHYKIFFLFCLLKQRKPDARRLFRVSTTIERNFFSFRIASLWQGSSPRPINSS